MMQRYLLLPEYLNTNQCSLLPGQSTTHTAHNAQSLWAKQQCKAPEVWVRQTFLHCPANDINVRHADHAEGTPTKAVESHKKVEEQRQQKAPDCMSRRRDVTEPEVVFVPESLGRTKTLP